MELRRVHFFYFFLMMIFCFSQFQTAISKDHHMQSYGAKNLNTISSHSCVDAKISNEKQDNSDKEIPNENIPMVCHHHCSDHLVYLYDLNFKPTLHLGGNIQFAFNHRKFGQIYIEVIKPPSESYLS